MVGISMDKKRHIVVTILNYITYEMFGGDCYG
ncbi:hypothetical protein M2149_002902 [Lachnospiraceae bacterium PFB1-21]